jgi:hypothetical protein
LEGGEPRDGHDRGLLEAEVCRLGREVVLASAGVLGEGAVAPAEHLITGPEPGHLGADRLDAPGDVHAQHGDLGLAQPQRRHNDADQVRQAGHDVPVAPMQAGRVDLYQHVVLLGHRLVDVPEVQHIGSAIPVLHDCLHRVLQRRRGFGKRRCLR